MIKKPYKNIQAPPNLCISWFLGALWAKENLLFWVTFSQHTGNRQLYHLTFHPQIIFYCISQYSCPIIPHFIIRYCNSSKAMHTIQIRSPVTQTFLPSFFMSLRSLKLNLKDITSLLGRDHKVQFQTLISSPVVFM